MAAMISTLLAPAPPVRAPQLTGDAQMDHVLAALGATTSTLSDQQRAELHGQGYLLLPAHMSPSQLAAMRAAHDRLMGDKYPTANGWPDGYEADYCHHEPGTRRLADLVSEDPVFDATYTDGLVLAAVAELMAAPFKHNSINAREALPGAGMQGFHRDRARRPDGREPGVNTAWLLDDFTALSGPTRVVPGSHRWLEDTISLPDGVEAHPLEVQLLAPAGSVMVFANTLWHSGTRNLGTAPRRVIHVSFGQRGEDLGQSDQRLRIRKAVWERISPEARWILAV